MILNVYDVPSARYHLTAHRLYFFDKFQSILFIALSHILFLRSFFIDSFS